MNSDARFPSSQLTVSFIVHNDYTHIQNALENLYATTQTPCMVYLTLNTGESPQSEQIRTKFPDVRIRVNGAPQGFAANHNAILRLAETPFVALLNDDIAFQPGALDTLVEYLREHADVGLVGPAVENPDGSAQQSTFSDPTLVRMLYHISGLNRFTQHGGRARRLLLRLGIARRLKVESLNTEQVIRDVPVVVGVVMVVGREAYLQAGLMDEHTVFYAEEFGWHWRIRQHGFRVVFVPEARVTHFNVQQDLIGWKLAEHRKGILAYFTLYRPRWQAFGIRLSILVAHGLAAVATRPFNRAAADAHWQAVRMAATWKPS